MKRSSEVSVTLTPELYERLADEARALDIAMEWLVASLVADTIEVERRMLVPA
jgi:hypothetical protein